MAVLPSSIFSALSGTEHLYIMALEMFFWGTPYVNRIFGLKDTEHANHASTRAMAANQGLYNGLLSAGLFWAAATAQPELVFAFNGAVIVAAIYAGVTVKPKLLLLQGGLSIVAVATAAFQY